MAELSSQAQCSGGNGCGCSEGGCACEYKKGGNRNAGTVSTCHSQQIVISDEGLPENPFFAIVGTSCSDCGAEEGEGEGEED